MITEKFEEWLDKHHPYRKDDCMDIETENMLKEAFTAGVQLGFDAVMDSKVRKELEKDLSGL